MAHIAFFMRDLDGGGIQKIFLQLASALQQKGHRIDLLVCEDVGAFKHLVPAGIKLITLKKRAIWQAQLLTLAADIKGLHELMQPILLAAKPSNVLGYLPGLANYLGTQQPSVIMAATPYLNITSLLAKQLAHCSTRIVISEHIDLRHLHMSLPGKTKKWRNKFLPRLLHRYYPWADAIIAVSNGVADSIAHNAGIPRQQIQTIYNPVVPANLQQLASEPINHPWFHQGSVPVILAVGRLDQQKDFPTLLRAFALVKAQRQAKLLILGKALNPKQDKEYRLLLEHLALELGFAEDMQIAGFQENPFAYMAHAAVLALSSKYEGFGNVIPEALACGCPVVSTDCPSGPAEILANGKYGRLVPVGDHTALAQALLDTLESPPDPEMLRARGMHFATERIVQKYEKIILE